MIPLDTLPWGDWISSLGTSLAVVSLVAALGAFRSQIRYSDRTAHDSQESLREDSLLSVEVLQRALAAVQADTADTNGAASRELGVTPGPSELDSTPWPERLLSTAIESHRNQTIQMEEQARARYRYSAQMARLSFWVAVPGITLIMAAAVLVVLGWVPAAVLTAVSGALVAGASGLVFRLSSEAKVDAQRADDAARRQIESQRKLALSASLIREVKDAEKRDDAYVRLAVNFSSIVET